MVDPLIFGEKYQPYLATHNFSGAEHIKNNSSAVSGTKLNERYGGLELSKAALSPEKEMALMQLYFMSVKVKTSSTMPSPLEILHDRSVQSKHLELNGQEMD